MIEKIYFSQAALLLRIIPFIAKESVFARIGLLDDAVEALVVSDDIRRRYLDLSNNVLRLYKAVLPDPAAREFAAEAVPVQVIAEKIKGLTPPPDISLVMQQVEKLLDRSISTEGYAIGETSEPFGDDRWVDLSNIDFEKLAERFRTGCKRTINEKLSGTVASKIMAMVRSTVHVSIISNDFRQ